MKYRVRLVNIARVTNRKLVVKRVASDLSHDLYKAELLLHQLPLDLERSVSEDEANKMIRDYERLGCLVMKEPEKEAEKPPDTGPRILVTPVVDPRMHGGGLRVSLAPAATPRKKKTLFRDILVMAGLLLLLGGMLFMAIRFSQKKQAAAKHAAETQRAPGAVAASLAGESDTGTAGAQEPGHRHYGPITGENKGSDSGKSAAGLGAKPPQAEKSPEALAKAMEQGLEKGPDRLPQKDGYSDQLVTKAENENDPFNRIKFYELAVSFNKFNEPAWNGLIAAYEAAKKQDKAEAARREKEALFGPLLSRIREAVEGFGKMKGRPVFSEGSVAVAYESKKEFGRKTMPEMQALAEKIRKIQPFKAVSITAYTDAGLMSGDF